MTEETVTNDSATSEEVSINEHTQLACKASCEIYELADHLQASIEKHCPGEEIEIIGRAILNRIQDLSNVSLGLDPEAGFGPMEERIEAARRSLALKETSPIK